MTATAPLNTRTTLPPEDLQVDGMADCERRITATVAQLKRLATVKVRLEIERLMREAMPELPGMIDAAGSTYSEEG